MRLRSEPKTATPAPRAPPGRALGAGVAVFGSLRSRTRDCRRERLVLHLFGALLVAACRPSRVTERGRAASQRGARSSRSRPWCRRGVPSRDVASPRSHHRRLRRHRTVLCRELAATGHDLIVVARRRDRLEALAQRLGTAHRSKVEVLVADLASEAGIDAVAERAAAAPLDLVINNAGMGGYRRFVELEPKVADALIAVHIRAVVRVTLAALPGMVERKRGGVINVASLLAFSGASTDAFLPKRVVYAGAKAFLVTFTQTLANELADTGVRVQVCLPGVIKTEFHEVQGMDLSKMPRMTPDDLARASLAGLRLGEIVCVPALEDAAAAQRIDEANRTVLAAARSTTIAARYR